MASRDNTRTAGANRNQNVADNMLQAGRLTLETVQQVAALAVALSEKLLRGELRDKQSQTQLADRLLDEINTQTTNIEA